jgi:hypothetical protein
LRGRRKVSRSHHRTTPAEQQKESRSAMTFDKEFITTLIAIVTATIVIVRKMVTKEDLTKLETKFETGSIGLEGKIDKLDGKIDRLSEIHHSDAMMLQRDIVGLHDRVAKVEKV